MTTATAAMAITAGWRRRTATATTARTTGMTPT